MSLSSIHKFNDFEDKQFKRRTSIMQRAIFISIPFKLMAWIGGIWAVVSFLLHLFKDTPFQWWSIVLMCVGLLGAAITLLVAGSMIRKVKF